MRQATRLAWALGLLVVLAAPGAGATLVRGFTLEAMTHEAHDVVRGEVVGEETVYDARWGRVYTHTFVRVDAAWSGDVAPGEVIAVRQIGGVLDGVETRVVGTADLLSGDELVVFARTDGAFHYLVGMSQGVYQVVRSGSAEPTVARGVSSMRLVTPVGPSHGPAPARSTLASLKDRVDAILRRAGGTR